MRVKLPIQTLRPAHYEPVEDQLMRIFYDIIFRPLAKLLGDATATEIHLLNTNDDVIRKALQEGRIQYADGIFSGQFSATIGRALRSIGATFNKRRSIYQIPNNRVPVWISAEAGATRVRTKELHRLMRKELDEIQERLDLVVASKDVDAEQTIGQFQKGFQKAAAILQVAPTLSTESKVRLVVDYNDNMKLRIKKFSEEMIADLRGVVTDNAEQGYRFDRLVDGIRNRYAVTENKAKFLARQETALFMSKFRRERFTEAGVRKYQWSAIRDERLRDSHKDLDGTIQFYDSPPIVDKHTTRRANPGEDYNCRCVDIPIIEQRAEAA